MGYFPVRHGEAEQFGRAKGFFVKIDSFRRAADSQVCGKRVIPIWDRPGFGIHGILLSKIKSHNGSRQAAGRLESKEYETLPSRNVASHVTAQSAIADR
jgi:hypothetical protein